MGAYLKNPAVVGALALVIGFLLGRAHARSKCACGSLPAPGPVEGENP